MGLRLRENAFLRILQVRCQYTVIARVVMNGLEAGEECDCSTHIVRFHCAILTQSSVSASLTKPVV